MSGQTGTVVNVSLLTAMVFFYNAYQYKSKKLNIYSFIVRRSLLAIMSLVVPMCAMAQEATSAEPSPKDQPINVIEPVLTVTPGMQNQPVWEFGIGGGYFSGFDYPASKDRNQRAIALPFFIYRTPTIRFGGGGVSAVAIENPRVKLDMSLGVSLNASSEGNRARAGMPDLDFLFEIGPQLEVRLLDTPVASGGRLKARFTSEVRAVFVTDFSSVGSQGIVAGLGLGMNYRRVRGSKMDLISSLSVIFANEKLQDYFYQVDPEFATPARAEFNAQGGYLESRIFAGAAFQPRKNVRIFLGAFSELYEGASNQESPLFETTNETGFILGFAWTIKTSDQMVEVVDMGGDS